MTEVKTALETAFTALGSDITGVIIMSIPIALGVIGIIVGVRFGIKWIRSMIKG